MRSPRSAPRRAASAARRAGARLVRLGARAATRLALNALVAVLLMPLACASMLPALARMAGGPPAHVCHCSAGGAHADCRVCNPRVDRLPSDERAITGRCGDDLLPSSGRLPFVVAAAAAPPIVAPSRALFGAHDELAAPADVESPPPSPPPRRAA